MKERYLRVCLWKLKGDAFAGQQTAATLSTDRRERNDVAVSIDGDHGYDSAIGEGDVLKRAIGVQEDLRSLTTNLFKIEHESSEAAGWQGKEQSITWPF